MDPQEAAPETVSALSLSQISGQVEASEDEVDPS